MSVILRIIYVLSLIAMVILGLISIASFFVEPSELVLNRIDGVNVELDSIESSDFVDGAQSFITAVMFVVVSRCLMVITKTISNGTPFEDENADRFSIMAKVVIYCEISKALIVPIAAILGAIIGVDYVEDATFRIELSNFLGAGIALVLAEVFREGARLRKEQELTV